MTTLDEPVVRIRRPAAAGRDEAFGRFARGSRSVADQMHRGTQSYARDEGWQPDVNLYEREDAYVVCVDLSGVEKQQIDLTVQNQSLRLRGDRAVPRQQPGARMRVHLMEIDHGAFSREVELPADVDRAAITASYENGMLWITLPKV